MNEDAEQYFKEWLEKMMDPEVLEKLWRDYARDIELFQGVFWYEF